MNQVVNQTEVCVIWAPHGTDVSRGVLQVTLRVGKRRSEQDHLAVQQFLDAVKRIQDLPKP